MQLTRRQLLKSLAGAGLLMPWLRPSLGYAASGAPPTRLLIWWNATGVPRHVYNFTSASGGAPTTKDFVFPSVRGALNAIKQDLIVLRNLDMVSATSDPIVPNDAHAGGQTHSLAAINRADKYLAGGKSIDQYIASAINSPSPVTRVPSLALAAQCDGNAGLTVCTSGPGTVVPFEPNPQDAYNSLFNGFVAPSAPSGPSDAELAAKKEAALQQSVLDSALTDFKAMRKKLSKEERAKFDTHSQVVRDLQTRLTLAQTVTPPATCSVPSRDILIGTKNAYPGDSTLFAANLDAMMHTVVAGFACDLTRVALFVPGEPFKDTWGYTSGMYGSGDAHDLIHKTSFDTVTGTLRLNPDAMATISAMHQREADQFATMVNYLRSVPDTDGKSLLDHTIVLWATQIAEHGHQVDQLPWIMAGGSAVGFKTGSYIDYGRTNNVGAPHNNLFVSIAQAMGVNTNTFGNPSVCTGPLPNLRS